MARRSVGDDPRAERLYLPDDYQAHRLPADWGEGWPHVVLCCTCETQERADYRLPIYLSLPLCRREVICEPLLERLDLSRYLAEGRIDSVSCGGESGDDARVCDFDWVLDLRRQCVDAGVAFRFRQTGARLRKEGRIYRIRRPAGRAWISSLRAESACESNSPYGCGCRPTRESISYWSRYTAAVREVL